MARVQASDMNPMLARGQLDGGIYALSLTGNAEGHLNALNDRDICR